MSEQSKSFSLTFTCPKCTGVFLKYDVNEFCEKHAAEYEQWLNDSYLPDIECDCGGKEWIGGELQMTDPPSEPKATVERCKHCGNIRLERSKTRIRIFHPAKK